MNSLAKLIQKELSRISPISNQSATVLSEFTFVQNLKKFEIIEKDGKPSIYEFYVKRGIVRSFVLDDHGNEITLNFYRDQQAISPSLLRAVNGISYLNLQVISSTCEIICFHQQKMSQMMLDTHDLDFFGQAVIMHDAVLRADKERILAKSKGLDKLLWFRKNFGGLENEISHQFIASFLGMTATSFSRLRGRN